MSASVYMNRTQLDTADTVVEKIRTGQYVAAERACPICASQSFTPIESQDRFGLPVATVLCHRCGLLQTNPVLREEDYIDFYRQHYHRLLSGRLVMPRDHFILQRQRGAHVLEYARAAGLRPGAVVLEVGCGPGGILSIFQEAGHSVIGLDVDTENLEFGRTRGLDLRNGLLKDVDLGVKPDLIIYSHVLEHLVDPRKELEVVQKWLAGNAMVYVEAPGLFNLGPYLWDLRIFLQFPHLSHFTLLSLRNLFESSGFRFDRGDEQVCAIFRTGHGRSGIQNQHEEVSGFLRRLEGRRNFLWSLKRRFYLTALAAASIAGFQRPLRKLYWFLQLRKSGRISSDLF